jgi:phosphatidylglycerol lysyltransferase
MHRARQLVLQHGYNATAYQILNPGITHWFSTSHPAVVGYVPRGRTWVAAGAPVCAAEHLLDVTHEFERAAANQNRRVCYVIAADRLENLLADSPGHARVVLGAQPVWNPQHWPQILRHRASLRAQLSRARNKGVTILPANPVAARNDPALHQCLAQWLDHRPMPTLHFLVEPDTFHGPLDDRRLFVASHQDKTVAFLLASPIPQRNGFLVEQIIRSPHAPNGTAELLIDALMTSLTDSGHTYVTMGLVALSHHADSGLQSNPAWLRTLMTWARAHANRFYHFNGLEHFRTKMIPDRWETLYAISNEKRFTPATLHNLLGAFAQTSLALLALHALTRALATEMGWLTQAMLEAVGG